MSAFVSRSRKASPAGVCPACGLTARSRGDQVVEYGGTKVLLVEEALADALAEATIDAEPTGQGDDLVISQPGQIEVENGNAEVRDGDRVTHGPPKEDGGRE